MPAGSDADLVIDGVPVLVEGEGAQALLMLHGWPDTHRLWDPQVARFAAHRRCVRFTLPGFDASSARPAPSLESVLALITKVVDAVSPDRPVELLLHDWGCGYGYTWAMRHPQRVRRLVGVDVGDSGSRAHRASLRRRDLAMIAAYQLWLAAAFRIGGRTGDAMARRMARLMHAPADPGSITAAMGRPYHQAWTGGLRELVRTLARFDPPCPMLYVYGERKPFPFHSPQWLDALAARPGCRVLALRAGHWVMHDRRDAFDAAVLGFLTGEDRPPAATVSR